MIGPAGCLGHARGEASVCGANTVSVWVRCTRMSSAAESQRYGVVRSCEITVTTSPGQHKNPPNTGDAVDRHERAPTAIDMARCVQSHGHTADE